MKPRHRYHYLYLLLPEEERQSAGTWDSTPTEITAAREEVPDVV